MMCEEEQGCILCSKEELHNINPQCSTELKLSFIMGILLDKCTTEEYQKICSQIGFKTYW